MGKDQTVKDMHPCPHGQELVERERLGLQNSGLHGGKIKGEGPVQGCRVEPHSGERKEEGGQDGHRCS